jgi:hypothetical protein
MLQQKLAMPFQRTWPPLFCPISPEAELLKKRADSNKSIKTNTKAGKGLTEKRAGSMACSAEAFFCLDFFGTFCVKTKRTSPAAIERSVSE